MRGKRFVSSFTVMLLICMTVGCAQKTQVIRKSILPDYPRSVMTAIGAIFNASRMYYNDIGSYPTDVSVLENQAYLLIDPTVKEQWTFEIVGAPERLSKIRAMSTEKMADGAGHIITYDVETGTFSGYGLTTE